MISTKTVSWTFLKSLLASKKVPIQYVEYNTSYHVMIVDGALTLGCVIDRSTTNSDLTDFESNYLSGANQALVTRIEDVLNVVGLQSELTVGTTVIEVKVGTNRLSNRKSVTLYNSSNSILYWGYTASVNTTTGTPIARNQYVEWSVGSSLPIYVISASAGNTVRITEAG